MKYVPFFFGLVVVSGTPSGVPLNSDCEADEEEESLSDDYIEAVTRNHDEGLTVLHLEYVIRRRTYAHFSKEH